MFSGIVEEYAEVVRIVKEQENLPDCCQFAGWHVHGYRHERNDRAFQHRLAESGR